MYLLLSNTGLEPEALYSPTGDFADVLRPGGSYALNDASRSALVVGFRPELESQYRAAARPLPSLERKLLELMVGRKARVRSRSGQLERISVTVQNGGPNPVRVILGGAQRELTVPSGKAQVCEAPGYLELHEVASDN